MASGARVSRRPATTEARATLVRTWDDRQGQARRILGRLVASSAERGLRPLEAKRPRSGVSDYCETWLARRKALGVGMVNKERRCLELYALDASAGCPSARSAPRTFAASLMKRSRAGSSAPRSRTSTERSRALFRAAHADELIDQNPVAVVRVPKVRTVRKERAILTDAEFARFIACAEVDLELRMLSLVARCEGGMRTGDLHRWDWSQIDLMTFAECIIPRAKTGTPQTLCIPGALAPFLRDWWERAGRPESGPVFPARLGKRAGQEKRPLTSYAKRLRRALIRACIWRLRPVEVPATKSGTRTDLGQSAPGTKLAPNPRDPLYFETATTLPVDFHSFRRAFASALAEAGVNVQHAMHLTAHSDPRVHARYVMRTSAMRAIPEAALPRLPVGALADARRRPRNVTDRDDSPLRPHVASQLNPRIFLAMTPTWSLPTVDPRGPVWTADLAKIWQDTCRTHAVCRVGAGGAAWAHGAARGSAGQRSGARAQRADRVQRRRRGEGRGRKTGRVPSAAGGQAGNVTNHAGHHADAEQNAIQREADGRAEDAASAPLPRPRRSTERPERQGAPHSIVSDNDGRDAHHGALDARRQ